MRAFWSRVSHSSRTTRQAARVADGVQAGDPAPRLDPGRRQRCGADGLELLRGPLGLARDGEALGQHLAQLHEHLDVERGVPQPLGRQRAGGPVDRRVLLGQPEPEGVGDDGGQPDPVQPEQPGAELGVEHPARLHALLGQPGQVLRRGVQDPLDADQRVGQRRQVGHRDGVDERGAGALAPQLHQVGALAVAVAGGALGVDGHRSGARAERGDDRGEGLGRLDDGRDALGGLGEHGDLGERRPSTSGSGVGRRHGPPAGAPAVTSGRMRTTVSDDADASAQAARAARYFRSDARLYTQVRRARRRGWRWRRAPRGRPCRACARCGPGGSSR